MSAEDVFRTLVAAARADRRIVVAEQKVLNAHIVKLGLDPAHARAIQAEAEADAVPRIRIPEDPNERLATFGSILKVAGADGTISPGELAAIRAFADRLQIDPGTLDGLIAAAVTSTSKLDMKLAILPRPDVMTGPAAVEFKAVPEAPRLRDHLRAMPFVARLAPVVRSCRNCSLPFANQDSYAKVCQPCWVNLGIASWTGSRIETLAGLLFIVLLLPVGYLVEKTTGLWSWGWNDRNNYSMSRSGFRTRNSWTSLVPAAAVTAIVAWLLAWAFEAFIMFLLGRRRTTTSD